MQLVVFGFSLVSMAIPLLWNVNVYLESQKQEAILIKTHLLDILANQKLNNNFWLRGDFSVNEFLVGILLILTVVGACSLLYSCYGNPQSLTNQIADGNQKLADLIESVSQNLVSDHAARSTFLLAKINDLENQIAFLNSNFGNLSTVSELNFQNIAEGFCQTVVNIPTTII